MSEQVQELDSAITDVKAGLVGLQTRVDTVVAALDAKNNQTEAIDLSGEIAELQGISASINGILPATESEPAPAADPSATPPTTSGDVSTTEETPPQSENP